ncbi:P-loop NTPase fold protein [Ralstonia pseudosolanacearum]|uniref:KAP family P-loop NTPase fold protein n=1 Tax=Ralstonia pseudosolanacearum TaxID=1310165 RepID=UPI0008DA9069|nr:P-loop NTPase fold protein [Ralstonia pseudosolanacearum]MCL1622607.1 KAP family NTPase [Ralstonia pseudosolanacearum CaRs-Mep]
MTTNPISLSLPSDRWDDLEEPFKGDILKRQLLAQQLTGYLGRLRDGAVIALDAPWGEGKSWFARHWAAQLRQDQYRVACIDAFENDYVEDPFVLLAAEVRRLSATNKELAERLGSQAIKLGKVVAPMLGKVTVNLIGKAVGTDDLIGEWSEQVEKAAEKGADAAQAWIKRRIEQHDKDRDTVRAFRAELETFAKADDQPVVIIIDELDRCRPAFAVRLLERIKHYFDVPNLVFVLVMNRRQLVSAIKGVYGADTDAETYLGKFLHLTLALPRARSWNLDQGAHVMLGFVGHVLRRYAYDDKNGNLGYFLTVWVEGFDLSLREIERACAMCFLVTPQWFGLLSFLVALRVKHPELFDAIRRDDSTAPDRAMRLVNDVNARAGQEPSATYVKAVYMLLALAAQRVPSDAEKLNADVTALLYGSPTSGPTRGHVKAMRALMQKLDFDVQ